MCGVLTLSDLYNKCLCTHNMGSGRDTDRTDDSEQSEQRAPWLKHLENWTDRSRRQFLAFLLAVIATVVTVTGLQQMFGVFDITDDEWISELERPAEPPTTIRVQEYDDEYRAIDDGGEPIDSGTDGWAVLETAIEAAPAQSTVFVRGRYEADEGIEVTKSLSLDGNGAHIAVQDTAEVAFQFSGEQRYDTALSAAVENGQHAIELDTVDGLERGDLVHLEDEDGPGVLGRGQPPGEPHSVLETADSTVELEDTIVWRDGYDSGTLVYVVDPIEVQCSGFEFVSPDKSGSITGIMARGCRDSAFRDLTVEKFGNRGIALEGCANTRIRDCTVLQSSDIDSADGYGIQIRAGCHDIVTEGCTAKECRHPLSVTPAGPREVASRSVTFRDCFVSADGSAALNCHGGSAHDVRFEGCMVHTRGEAGVRTGAQKTCVTGCEFRMETHNAITTRNDGQEMVLTVTDTDIYGAGNAVELDDDDDYEFDPLWKLVHIDGVRAHDCARFLELEDGNVDRVRKLVVRNSSWDTVSRAGIRLDNQIDGGSIEGNEFGAAPENSHIRVRNSRDTDVRNLHITGNRFLSNSGDQTFIRLSDARHCVISDNTFESESNNRIFADDTGSTHNIVKQNTYFGPGAATDAIQTDGRSRAVDNHFFDTNDEE